MLTKQKPLPPVSASEITCDDGEKKKSLCVDLNPIVFHSTAKSAPIHLHGDGRGYEHLRHREGSGADIATGAVTQVSLPHMKHVLINLLGTGPERTHYQSAVMDEGPLI